MKKQTNKKSTFMNSIRKFPPSGKGNVHLKQRRVNKNVDNHLKHF